MKWKGIGTLEKREKQLFLLVKNKVHRIRGGAQN